MSPPLTTNRSYLILEKDPAGTKWSSQANIYFGKIKKLLQCWLNYQDFVETFDTHMLYFSYD